MATPEPKHMFDREAAFWEAYAQGRPYPPDSFFTQILSYHASHQGGTEVLHDAGAGSSVHTARLAGHFQRTIVSDPSESNIEAAKQHLNNNTSIGTNSALEFHVSKFEDSSSWLPPSSVDFLFAANMIHWTDLDAAVAAAAHQLRPHGTLAIAGFGFAVLDDPDLQNHWLAIVHRYLEALAAQHGGQSGPVPMARTIIVSNYDAVPLPAGEFRDVVRLRVNFRKGWSIEDALVPPSHREAWVKAPERVLESDSIRYEENPDWGFKRDLRGLRLLLDSMALPTPDEELERLWRQFAEVVGEREVEGIWPAMIVLGSRI